MINKAILIGNLGKDPDLKTKDGGTTICKFGLATSERWTDKSGKKQEKTAWHNIVCFGKTAEIAGKYLKKGSKVFVEGKISYRAFDDRDGNSKVITEIIANNVTFLNYPKGSEDQRRGPDPFDQTPTGDGGFNQDPGRPARTQESEPPSDNPLIRDIESDNLPF